MNHNHWLILAQPNMTPSRFRQGWRPAAKKVVESPITGFLVLALCALVSILLFFL